MFFRPNASSGVPIYLQLMEQVKHAVETGALRPGDQLPGIRPLSEELVINVNTVAKAYRELEHAGVIVIRHGAGAFVSDEAPGIGSTRRIGGAREIAVRAIRQLRASGLSDGEIRRLLEAGLSAVRGKSGD